MLETPHVVVAAAIAYKVGNPALAIPLAFGSHFILELVPHWNPHLNTEMKKFGKVSPASRRIVMIDAFLALTLGTSIAALTLPNLFQAAVILAACFFGVLPDLVEAPFYFLKKPNKFIEKIWIPFQKSLQSDTTPLPGLLTQAATVIAAFWWILT